MRKLLFLVFLLGSLSAFSQRTVTGTVIDAETQTPLPGANVIEAGNFKRYYYRFRWKVHFGN